MHRAKSGRDSGRTTQRHGDVRGFMNGVLAPFQDPELAFIPAAASLFTGRNRVYVCMYVYVYG